MATKTKTGTKKAAPATSGDFFDALQAAAEPKAKKKKNDMPHYRSEEFLNPTEAKVYNQTVLDWVQAVKTEKEAKAEKDRLRVAVLEGGKKAFCDIYNRTGEYPGTFIINDCLMVEPSDKYIDIDKAAAEELNKQYPGKDVVSSTTEFTFDDKLFQKYREVLAKFFKTCKDISDEDRGKLIVPVTEYSIKKGTIKRLHELEEVKDALEAVRPVIMLKPVGE